MRASEQTASQAQAIELRRVPRNPFARLSMISETRFWAYVLIAPSLLMVLAVILYPIASGITLSFRRYRLNRLDLGTGFIGLQHYADLVADPVFQRALVNTMLWVVLGVASQFALGLATALALNRPLRGMRLARVLVLLPWILPTVVAGNMWAMMLDFRLGVINDILVKLGLLVDYKAWFSDPTTAFPAVLVVALWQGFPFFTLLLLAGLQGIPDELYEAAAVDGANRWRQFVHITIPLLRPVIVAVVVLRVIGLVNSPDLMIILTNGGPGDATQVLSSYAVQIAYREFNYGYASAIAVIMLVLLMVFTVIYVRVSGLSRGD